MQYRCREILGGAAAGAVVLAGCSGSNNSDTYDGTPPDDADPAELLPEVPDGWEMTDEGSLTPVKNIEAGSYGFYTDPEDTRYEVEITRYESGDVAATAPYGDWPIYVTRGNFGFASHRLVYDGPPEMEKLSMLMGHSPVLTEEYVRSNNLNQ